MKTNGATVIVGGFWGDEGKGKIADYIAVYEDAKAIARAGVGPNAGHTVIKDGVEYKLRMLPSAFDKKDAKILIGAGVLVDPRILLQEINLTDTSDRVIIDRQTGIIEQEHIEQDTRTKQANEIGTTGSGCGPANADRANRILSLAKDTPELQRYLGDVSEILNNKISEGSNVLIESSQATFLSLYHGTYPYVTSKDVTASAACSDVGLGPTKVKDVILTLKAFVTRVGTGDLPGELTEEEIKKRNWYEEGTVTGRARRAAPFNFDLAKKSAQINGATQIALTKLDILYPELEGCTDSSELSTPHLEFIGKIEKSTGVRVTLIGTGPDSKDIIHRP